MNIRGRAGEQLGEAADVVVRKHASCRRRQADPVDQAGVISLIREHHVTLLRHRRHHGDIGEISARKIQGPLGALEFGEPPLNRREPIAMAAEQPRAGTAASLALDSSGQARDDQRVGRQVEVVVRGEIGPARRLQRAEQSACFPFGQAPPHTRFEMIHSYHWQV
jgi:hypothetical protein